MFVYNLHFGSLFLAHKLCISPLSSCDRIFAFEAVYLLSMPDISVLSFYFDRFMNTIIQFYALNLIRMFCYLCLPSEYFGELSTKNLQYFLPLPNKCLPVQSAWNNHLKIKL